MILKARFISGFFDLKKILIFTASNKLKNMEYSIRALEIEKEHVDKCLSNWDIKKYPEARKRQVKTSKDLEKAINLLKKANQKDTIIEIIQKDEESNLY